jgi:hypothetical protein
MKNLNIQTASCDHGLQMWQTPELLPLLLSHVVADMDSQGDRAGTKNITEARQVSISSHCPLIPLMDLEESETEEWLSNCLLGAQS